MEKRFGQLEEIRYCSLGIALRMNGLAGFARLITLIYHFIFPNFLGLYPLNNMFGSFENIMNKN